MSTTSDASSSPAPTGASSAVPPAATPVGPMEPTHHYVVSVAPHIKAEEDVPQIMQWVCIALAPAFAVAVYNFGWWCLVVTAVTVSACMATEYLCQRWRGRPATIHDFSAVVTGLLIAAVLPPNTPLWLCVVGAVFGIGVGKMAFGGLGNNIWNPALLARAFLQAARPSDINSGRWPFAWSRGAFNLPERFSATIRDGFQELTARTETLIQENGLFPAAAGSPEEAIRAAAQDVDVVTSATMLARIGVRPLEINLASYADGFTWQAFLDRPAPGGQAEWLQAGYWRMVWDSFLGLEPGCIAEVSALALLLGGLLLLWRGIITWEIPVVYIATVGLLGWLLPAPFIVENQMHYTAWACGPWALHLVGGGLMIGAFFMATDMVTSPMTRTGKLIFGFGCGLLTILIRVYSNAYPEGVCYSILLMNTCAPLIDLWTRPRKFGQPKPARAAGAPGT